jgi:hypothetical protein
MPTVFHEPATQADAGPPPPRRRRRPRQVVVGAWVEAIVRKLLRAYNDRAVRAGRRLRRSRFDPYSTFPEQRLSPDESDRLAEIVRRHQPSL